MASVKPHRGVKTDLQTLRTKLLYFIYCAPESRVKDEPGIKSKICKGFKSGIIFCSSTIPFTMRFVEVPIKALGYKSDGHFHYDWNYLLESHMLQRDQGYFTVTDEGKKEFELHSSASKSTFIMIAVGLALIFVAVGLKLRIFPAEGVAILGVVLIYFGVLFSMISKRNEPKLPIGARVLLRKLRRYR